MDDKRLELIAMEISNIAARLRQIAYVLVGMENGWHVSAYGLRMSAMILEDVERRLLNGNDLRG